MQYDDMVPCHVCKTFHFNRLELNLCTDCTQKYQSGLVALVAQESEYAEEPPDYFHVHFSMLDMLDGPLPQIVILSARNVEKIRMNRPTGIYVQTLH